MIIKIVGAGEDCFQDLYHHDEDEYLIGVDGGALAIIKMNLPLSLALGDFDSGDITQIKPSCLNIITYPPHKDKSDLELALMYVDSSNLPIDKILIYNSTGKRLDHYQSVLNILLTYSHLPIYIIDKLNLIYLIDKRTFICKENYKYISFFATTKDTIISLQGFAYDLDNYHLEEYDNLCLSNEIIKDKGLVTVNNKKVIVIQSN